MKDKTFWRSSLIFCGVALVLGLLSAYYHDVVVYYRDYCVLGVITTLLAFELGRRQRRCKAFYESEEYKDMYARFKPDDVKFVGLLMPHKMSVVWAWLNRISAILGLFGVLYYPGFLAVYLLWLSVVLNGYAVYHLCTTPKVKAVKTVEVEVEKPE